MKTADIHPSHRLRETWELRDPHNPGVTCTRCGNTACLLCATGDGIDDEDLAAPCPGELGWARGGATPGTEVSAGPFAGA